MTPEDYIKAVEDKFYECKRKGLGRLSMDWAVFSGEINREYTAFVKTLDKKSELAFRFVNAFLYWQNLARMLDMHCSKSPLVRMQIPKTKKTANDMRKRALFGGMADGVQPPQPWPRPGVAQ